jgi:hypothetical protein
MASSNRLNHRRPVSPACSEMSQSRIPWASRSASSVISTRKAMLYAQFFENLSGRPSASCLHVLIASANCGHRLLIVVSLPFQIFGQSVIERRGGVLAPALRERFQLGLAFRFDGYYIHDAFRVALRAVCVGGLRIEPINPQRRSKGASDRVCISRKIISGAVTMYSRSARTIDKSCAHRETRYRFKRSRVMVSLRMSVWVKVDRIGHRKEWP